MFDLTIPFLFCLLNMKPFVEKSRLISASYGFWPFFLFGKNGVRDMNQIARVRSIVPNLLQEFGDNCQNCRLVHQSEAVGYW